RVRRGLVPGQEVVGHTFTRRDVTYYRFQSAGDDPRPIYDLSGVPRLLFLSTGTLTLVVLLVLWWQMPDLLTRTFLWYRSLGRYRLEIGGMHHLPAHGPVLL